MSLRSCTWVVVGLAALVLSGGTARGSAGGSQRYTAEDAVDLARRMGKLRPTPKGRSKLRKRLSLASLTSGSGTISRQHVRQVLRSLFGSDGAPLTKAHADELQQVLLHPHFLNYAEPAAKMTLVLSLRRFEDTARLDGIRRWERSQSRSRQADREMWGY